MRAELLVMFVMGLFFNDKKMPFSDVTIITSRSIDITTQLSKYVISIKAMNKGNDVSYFIHPLLKEDVRHLSYITAFEGNGQKQQQLQVSELEDSFGSNSGYVFYKIEFASPLKKDTTLEFQIEYILFECLKIHPMEIAPHQSQFVLWEGSSNYVSVYPIESDKTIVNVGNGKVLSFTGTKLGDKILYGPTKNIAPFTFDRVSIHFENNAPFITVTNLERTIEIPPWGKSIVIKDYIEIVHKGAEITGTIFDDQLTQSSLPAAVVTVLKAILPSQAYDIKIRDILGDLSSSTVNQFVDHVNANVHLRFHFLHGMITHYSLQYSIPSKDFISSFGSNLKMPIIDSLFDGMYIKRAEIRIIFPKFFHNINIVNPSNISTVTKSFISYSSSLDTVGHPTVLMEMQNLVFNPTENLMITYDWNLSGEFIKSLIIIILLVAALVFISLFFLNKPKKHYVPAKVK